MEKEPSMVQPLEKQEVIKSAYLDAMGLVRPVMEISTDFKAA